MKLLSVAVPCYNSQDYMRHCVETLLTGGETTAPKTAPPPSPMNWRRPTPPPSGPSTRRTPATAAR